MKMQMGRDYGFVSKSGLSWNFEAGVPKEIPQKFAAEVLQAGGFFVQDADGKGAEQVAEIEAAKLAADGRVPAIEAAIKALVARNQRGDFTAGGRPNLNVLFRDTGIQLTSAELDPIWDRVRKELA